MPLPGDFEVGVTSVNGSVRDEVTHRPPDGGDPRSAHDSEDLFRFDDPQPHRPGAAGRSGFTGQATEARRPRGRVLERLRGWIVDRLPDPLKGRWRMDHRVGTALSAVAVVCGISMGCYALLTSQPQEQPQQFSMTRAAGRDSGSDTGRGADQGSDGSGSQVDGSQPSSGRKGLAGADSEGGSDLSGGSMPIQGSGATAAGIMVDVEGKVARPGVQRLPEGARVLDAIMLAGGPLPGTDLSNLDQARVLGDGEQIMVGPGAGAGPAVGAGGSAPAARGGRSKAVPTAPIRLNTATLEQLEELPGVGPALAQRVLDWRTEHGRFGSIEDLQQVKGFGPHKFAAVQALVAL